MSYKKNIIIHLLIYLFLIPTVLICTNEILYAGKRILFEKKRIVTVEYPEVIEKTITKRFEKAEGKVTIQFYAESDNVVRGQNFDVKIVLSWVGDEDLYRIVAPQLDLHNFTLQNISKSAVTENQEEELLQKKIITYLLKGNDVGDGIIESFKCHFYRKGSPSPYVISVPKSVIPIVEIVWNMPTGMIVFALLGSAFLTILIIVLRDIKGYKKKPRDEKIISYNAKIEEMLQRLDELKTLFSQGDAKTFFIKTSLILSEYLTKEYSLGAEQNIINEIDTFNNISSADKIMVKNVFQLCEKVQFAGYKCERKDVEDVFNKVVIFIKGKKIV